MYSFTKLYFLNDSVKNTGLPVLSRNDNFSNLLDYIVINKIHYSIKRPGNIYILLPVLNLLFLAISFSCFIFKK